MRGVNGVLAPRRLLPTLRGEAAAHPGWWKVAQKSQGTPRAGAKGRSLGAEAEHGPGAQLAAVSHKPGGAGSGAPDQAGWNAWVLQTEVWHLEGHGDSNSGTRQQKCSAEIHCRQGPPVL